MTQIKVSRGNYTGYDALLKSAGVYNVDADIDMNSNELRDLDDLIFAESGQEIRSTTNGLELRVPTADLIDFYINNIYEYALSSLAFDLKGNELIGVGRLSGNLSSNIIDDTSSGWSIEMATGADLDIVFNNVINYSFDENEFFMGANYIRAAERSDPAAPSANHALLYCRDNGSGKTQWVARFPTGAVQVIATEP